MNTFFLKTEHLIFFYKLDRKNKMTRQKQCNSKLFTNYRFFNSNNGTAYQDLPVLTCDKKKKSISPNFINFCLARRNSQVFLKKNQFCNAIKSAQLLFDLSLNTENDLNNVT